jgi:pRiA4b ORF-3-like protein
MTLTRASCCMDGGCEICVKRGVSGKQSVRNKGLYDEEMLEKIDADQVIGEAIQEAQVMDDLDFNATPKVTRILSLFAQHGHDLERLIAAHPEITREDVDEVTNEVARIFLSGVVGPPKRARRNSKKRSHSGLFQLKITLRGSKPPIWRRVVVPGDSTLARLHGIIQVAMGWQDGHLHMFEIDGDRFAGRGFDDSELDDDELDEAHFRLGDLVNREKPKFNYCYDFGDNWQHTLLVEKILPAAKECAPVICLAGKGRCPPEDCGGIWGYYRLLAALANPNDPEHQDMLEWAGDSIDPTQFDIHEVNQLLVGA